MVNDAIAGFGICEAPHGGFKASGIGRTHGLPGMAEMVRVRYIDVDRLMMKKPWWYGYKGASANRSTASAMRCLAARWGVGSAELCVPPVSSRGQNLVCRSTRPVRHVVFDDAVREFELFRDPVQAFWRGLAVVSR